MRKIIIIYTLIFLFSVTVYLLFNIGYFNKIYDFKNFVTRPIESVISDCKYKSMLAYKSLVGISKLYKENVDLRLELIKAKESCRSEIHKHSKAKIIDYNYRDNPNMFLINKGKKEGINGGEAVVVKDVYLGAVAEVYTYNSVVLGIDKKNSYKVYLHDSKINAILGYKAGKFTLMDIPSNIKVHKGEKFSLVDVNFPSRILLGEIVDEQDKYVKIYAFELIYNEVEIIGL